MKWVFFLYGLNNSESVVFGNADSEEIKDRKLIAKTFQKNFLQWKF